MKWWSVGHTEPVKAPHLAYSNYSESYMIYIIRFFKHILSSLWTQCVFSLFLRDSEDNEHYCEYATAGHEASFCKDGKLEQ